MHLSGREEGVRLYLEVGTRKPMACEEPSGRTRYRFLCKNNNAVGIVLCSFLIESAQCCHKAVIQRALKRIGNRRFYTRVGSFLLVNCSVFLTLSRWCSSDAQ